MGVSLRLAAPSPKSRAGTFVTLNPLSETCRDTGRDRPGHLDPACGTVRSLTRGRLPREAASDVPDPRHDHLWPADRPMVTPAGGAAIGIPKN